jgi:hypothetical protein
VILTTWLQLERSKSILRFAIGVVIPGGWFTSAISYVSETNRTSADFARASTSAPALSLSYRGCIDVSSPGARVRLCCFAAL